MARKRFSEREVIETLISQGAEITCFRCKAKFFVEAHSDLGLANEMYNRHHTSNIEREHLHEIALGGADEPKNCRYSCKWSHGIITNGVPATTAGSSKHRIAKTRGTRAEKFAVKKMRLDKPREPKRGFGKPSFARKP